VKPLLVGNHPTRAGDHYWHRPLSGVFARTVCRIAGIEGPSSRDALSAWTDTLYDHFDCINAIHRYPHEGWNRQLAASNLGLAIMPGHEVVVLLGRKVQDAYAAMTAPAETPVEEADFYEWKTDPTSPTGRREVIVLPAPAVVQAAKSEPAARRVIGRILNEAMEKAREMEATRL
jgi:hypothetical protein